MQVGILYKIINFFLDARLKLGIITFCSVTGMGLPFQARFPQKCPPFRLIFLYLARFHIPMPENRSRNWLSAT